MAKNGLDWQAIAEHFDHRRSLTASSISTALLHTAVSPVWTMNSGVQN